MRLDETVLQQAREARDRCIRFQHEAELARVSYQHAIRRLHAAGGSLREIADALGLSYQRVHQIVDVASGKGAVKPAARRRTSCSFCGRAQPEVHRLICGPNVGICNTCVDLAQEALDTGGAATGTLTRLVSLDASEPRARCSFCGKRRDQVAGMAQTPDRLAASKYSRRRSPPRVCGECLDLCGEIIAEEGGE